MNYDSFLMYNLLIEEGVSVDGMLFIEYPVDERYDMMPKLLKNFESHPLNKQHLDAQSCMLSYINANHHSLMTETQVYKLLDIELNNQEYWNLSNAVKAGDFDNHPCGYTIYKLVMSGRIVVKEVSNA